MRNRLKSRAANMLQGLWFVPALIIVLCGILAVGLVRLDEAVDLSGSEFVFQGNEDAARSVLQVIAGSLITVAGVTFSITVVVLQLASSQFSPRILRTFFGDRLTQATAGTFVGVFVFALILLRAVGGHGNTGGFVPRLGVTVASGFAVIAVILLIVFIHHISRMIQVSETMGGIAHQTLGRIDDLYPDPYGRPLEGKDPDAVLERWREEPAHAVGPSRPGYVQRIGVDELVASLDEGPERIAILVRPGDFVSVESVVAQVWPADAGEHVERSVRNAVTVAGERDLNQDVAFGMRQLTDTAVKAMSPSINDPTTACTCVGYLRAIAVRLAERSAPPEVRRYDDLTVIARRRRFHEHLEAFVEIGRYAAADGRVTGAILTALAAVVDAAARAQADERVAAALDAAETVAAQAESEARNERDRETVARLAARIERRASAGAAR